MQSTIKRLLVKPVFSLEGFTLDKLVAPYAKELEQLLQNMKASKDWPSMLLTAEKVPTKMLIYQKQQKVSLIQELYESEGECPAQTPYLLGCLKKYPDQVKTTLRSVQSIEVLEPRKDGCCISSLHQSQLCIRRNDSNKLVLMFSDYVKGGFVRYDERTSDSSVHFLLATVPVTVSEYENVKTIG